MAGATGHWRRLPAVAGSFYPGSAAALTAALQQMHAEAERQQGGELTAAPVLGVVCPHAGYVYAGAVALGALARCELPETIVILGVNHRHPNPPAWSLWPEGVWQTPLGDVPVNAALAQALVQACPELTASRAAHEQDHAIEVLLPMLQWLRSQRGAAGVNIVPITPFVARATEAGVVDVGRRLGAALAAWPAPTLVVASNDMTHFATAADAAAQDAKAFARMTALDAAGLLTTARTERITMCGAQSVAAMLAAAAAQGATRGQVTGYSHSGQVTGNSDEVVAYAGMVIV